MNKTKKTFLEPAESNAVAVDLNQAVYALSDALDLVGIDDVGHGKRVGVMAESCVAITDKPTAHQGKLRLARK